MHHGRSNQYSFLYHDKKIVLHPMSHEAIVHDDVARTRKLKSQAQTKSENNNATKSDLKNKNEITLKGDACLLRNLLLMN